MNVLFAHSENEIYNQMKFHAALHGVDLENPGKGARGKKQQAPEKPVSDDGEDLRFRSKEEYAKMDPAERKRMTQKMMGYFKNWAKKTPLEAK